MIELRQSTAGQEIPLGYFLDSTDGNTEETGLTIANTDIKLWKFGATTLANKNSGGATHISNGVYYCVLDATDTNTLGALIIFVHVSGALAIKVECAVLPANVWDSKYSTDKLQVDTVEVSGTSQTANDNGADINTILSRIIGTLATGTHNPQSGDAYAIVNNGTYGNSAIEALVDDLESRLTATRAGYLDNLSAGAVAQASVCTETRLAELDAANLPADVDSILTDTGEIGAAGVGLSNIPWNASWDAEVQSEVQDAIEANHLDHLFAVDYNPASKPGTATALLNELVEDDGGVSRFTANTLEEAPSGTGGDATAANQAIILAKLLAYIQLLMRSDAAIKTDNATELTAINADGGSGAGNYDNETDSNEATVDTGNSSWTTGGDATAANQTTITTHLTDLKGAGFVGSTDSNEAIRNRGDAAWTTGGGMSGSNAVTINVKDQSSNNIVECAVEVWDSDNTTLYERQNTNSSGNSSFNMDDGTYTIRMHKAGYNFDNQTLVVSGASTENYTGDAISVGTPGSANSCRIYDYLMMPDGSTPVTDVLAIMRIISLPEDANSVLHSGDEVIGTYSSDDGLVYWDVVRFAEAQFIIKDFGVDKTIPIPDSSTARLSDQ